MYLKVSSVLLKMFLVQVVASPSASNYKRIRSVSVPVNDGSCGDITLDLYVSPRLNRTISDVVEMAWTVDRVLAGDWIGLFDFNPNSTSASNLEDHLYSAPVTLPSGVVFTGVQIKRNLTTARPYEAGCLGYWAVYVRGDSGEAAVITCLSTEPRWMENSWNEISKLSLASAFLPGTHNSAAFKEVYSPYYENLVHKYTYNQDLNIHDQLVFGARVLDLRIAHYSNTEQKWWSNHDFIRLRPFKEVLDDVKRFLDNTKEIVILDIHNFPVGFKVNSAETHREFVRFLEEEVGDRLIPASLGWSAPLSSLLATGRRLVVAYNSQNASAPFLWYPIWHRWGNKQDVPSLHTYFSDVFSGHNTAPWSAMMELTPRPLDVLLDTYGGLREMAADSNVQVNKWLQGSWGRSCNVVSVDFIRGTSIIKSAIKWNRIRAGHLACGNHTRT
ncbi:uncharacterized protein LOC111048297 [Nilaparvata lugens]|uniref:uncharacterized protein LOC111048297 n=1 Tax=Nilaparvata lugens TaxID=108931 RepID=UPI000B97F73C|nr:uncharacterized protein LOC111048297 [Nilaparvata lugens]